MKQCQYCGKRRHALIKMDVYRQSVTLPWTEEQLWCLDCVAMMNNTETKKRRKEY